MLNTIKGLALVFAVLGAGLAGCDDDDGNSLPPPIPSGVFSVTGDGWVDVYWNPIRGVDDLAGYGVYRSAEPEGPYFKLAEKLGVESDFYRDETAENGTTYYYAVDAFDHDGNESALSVENVFDTPRPSRAGLRVYTRQWDPNQAGVDFSEQPDHTQMRGSWDLGDIYVEADADGFFRVIGTSDADDLQDLGWTSSFDEVGYAPSDGWVSSPVGLELVLGHTYVLWTADDYYAKFRVTAIEANAVVFEWAYQIDQGNPELVRPGVTS